MTAGRPTKYRDEYVELAYKFCLLGATDAEMAKIFEINQDTLYEWQKAHPEFSESIRRGKDIADANVAERLYQRAIGYEHDEVHVSNFQGQVTLTPLRKYYPPDTNAASLWLRNRQPAKWRDKTEVTSNVTATVAEMTLEQQAEAARRSIREAFAEVLSERDEPPRLYREPTLAFPKPE